MAKSIQAKYREAVHRALERCQFVEETLRAYLELTIQIAKIKLSPHFPVNITTKNLSKLSLGKLVNKFSQFNGNSSLKTDLKRITPDRNRVAHQSLLFTLGELGDKASLSKLTDEINEIESRFRFAHEAILDERCKLIRCLSSLSRQKGRKATN